MSVSNSLAAERSAKRLVTVRATLSVTVPAEASAWLSARTSMAVSSWLLICLMSRFVVTHVAAALYLRELLQATN